jgi:hypothetical protein
MADFCVYWFRRAHDHLPPCTPADPVAGRTGLVGTQNIRNNASRVGGLDHIVKDGTIIEAVDNQPWSGEANVHVSIANWVKTQDPVLLPKQRRLWHKVEPSAATKKQWKKQGKKSSKEYELSFREVPAINSALSDQQDLSIASRLDCNLSPQVIFRGLEPGNMGFLLDPSDALRFLKANPLNAKVVNPYLNGRELLSGNGTPERWLIDFQRMAITDALAFTEPFDHLRKTVLPQMERIDSKDATEGNIDSLVERIQKRQLVPRLKNWWQLRRCVPDTVHKLSAMSRYVACSMVTKRPVFVFLQGSIRPSNLVQSFALPDDYSFGILQSSAHWLWFITKCSKLKADFRYTPESVFDTFPWPQDPNPKAITVVAEAGREVRRIREEALQHLKGGLRALYRTLELPGANPLKEAHAALDAAVLAAYGFDLKADLLAQLLDLNQSVAAKIAASQPVTAPGLPPIITNPAPFITPDCISPITL